MIGPNDLVVSDAMKIEKLSADPETERELHFLELDDPSQLPMEISLSTRHFACFVAWEADDVQVEDVMRIAEILLSAGGAVFGCWGSGCRRIQEIIDEIDSDPFREKDVPDDAVIMTSWHEDESLEDALWFFLNESTPDTHFEETLGSSLAISIGAPESAAKIRAALERPREFSTELESAAEDAA